MHTNKVITQPMRDYHSNEHNIQNQILAMIKPKSSTECIVNSLVCDSRENLTVPTYEHTHSEPVLSFVSIPNVNKMITFKTEHNIGQNA